MAASEDDSAHPLADLGSHHIEGWVEGFHSRQRIPLVSQIAGDLWMGGCIDGTALPRRFRSVISLYPHARYRLNNGTERIEYAFKDASYVPELGRLHTAARQVLEHARRGPTLVHCQAGLNRSGLVVGLALVLDGYTPSAAIELLRTQRSPAVLCNTVFDQWLRTFNPEELPVADLLDGRDMRA